MRTADALLVAAYGIDAMLKAGHTLRDTGHTEGSCMGDVIKPWVDGNLLHSYLLQVSNAYFLIPLTLLTLNYWAHLHPHRCISGEGGGG